MKHNRSELEDRYELQQKEKVTMKDYQQKVGSYVFDVFGEDVASNTVERSMRFLEEAIELCQSLGMSKEESTRILDYVYNRPKGKPEQEVGGVMVTLASLAYSTKMNLAECAEDEFNRIDTPSMKKKLLEKQEFKRGQGITNK